MRKLILAVFLASFFLTGCVNLHFPDMLKGHIKNGIYTTHIGKYFGSFYRTNCNLNVMIQQMYHDFGEEHFMPTREVYGDNYTYLAFGPLASDATTYRVLVAEKCAMPLWVFKDIYFPMIIALSAKADNRQMFKIFEEHIRVDNRPAIYEVYTHKIPGNFQYYSTRQTGDILLTHAFYFIDYGRYGAVLWIQTSSDSGMWGINKKNRYKIIHRTWKPQIRFVRSFYIS